jgi:hypothetical protein
VEDEALAGETTDPNGERVVLLDAVWREKIVRDHPEIGPSLPFCKPCPRPITLLATPSSRSALATTCAVPARASGCWSS